MGRPRRPIPDGFEEDMDAGMSNYAAQKKYKAHFRIVKRWEEELGYGDKPRKRRDERCHPVEQYNASTGELMKVWPSQTAAANAMYGNPVNNQHGISRCCRGIDRTACGYVWKYKEEENVDGRTKGQSAGGAEDELHGI